MSCGTPSVPSLQGREAGSESRSRSPPPRWRCVPGTLGKRRSLCVTGGTEKKPPWQHGQDVPSLLGLCQSGTGHLGAPGAPVEPPGMRTKGRKGRPEQQPWLGDAERGWAPESRARSNIRALLGTGRAPWTRNCSPRAARDSSGLRGQELPHLQTNCL